MNILGISGYDDHDSSVCILKDGMVTSFCHEERLNRLKHTVDFPARSILYALKQSKLDFNDIDMVGYFKNPWIRVLASPGFLVKNFPHSIKAFQLNRAHNIISVLGMKWSILRKIGATDWNGKFRLINHHLAHAASAYYLSGFKRAAILSMDFSGEYHSTWAGVGFDNRIHNLFRIPFPHSLGLLYGAVTTWLGWPLYSGAGKMMGLSAYGTDAFVEKARKVYLLDSTGFRLDLRYFDVGYYRMNAVQHMISRLFIEEFGPPRNPDEPLEPRHADVARAFQLALEDIVVHLARILHHTTDSENLCLTGGVALNSVANGRIIRESPFSNVSIMPICADAGCALGAALTLHYRHLLTSDKSGQNP